MELEVTKENENTRLDVFVFRALSKSINLSRSFVARYQKDFVKVNGKAIKSGYKVVEGDSILIDEDWLADKVRKIEVENQELKGIVPTEGKLDVIKETDDWIVINKPPRVPVHPGISHTRDTVANYFKHYLLNKGVYDNELDRSGIVHRLDKDVSGLMLLAKNKAAQEYFRRLFKKHAVLKIYKAQVRRVYETDFSKEVRLHMSNQTLQDVLSDVEKKPDLTEKWIKVEGYIGRDRVDRKLMRFYFPGQEDSTSRNAVSLVLPLSEETFLIRIITGRMHQIRATLKTLGYAVRGDRLYGSKDDGDKEMGLKEVMIGFKDLDGEKISIRL